MDLDYSGDYETRKQRIINELYQAKLDANQIAIDAYNDWLRSVIERDNATS